MALFGPTGAPGGATAPAGLDTMVQYNNAGSFGGSSGFTFDDVSEHGALGPDAVLNDDLFGVGTTGLIILNVAQDVTSIPDDFFYGQSVAVNLNLGSDPAASIIASNTQMQTDVASTNDFLGEYATQSASFLHHGTGEIGLMNGVSGTVANYSTGLMDAVNAGAFSLSQPHAGTITDGAALNASLFQANGIWTNAKGLTIALTKDGGTMGDFTGVAISATVNAPITTASGITIDDLSAIATTSRNLWSKGATAINLLEGPIVSKATTPPTLANGQFTFTLDESGNRILFSVKYAGGSSKTGAIALT